MARNRKLRSAAVRFGPAIKALLLCLLIGGSGVGYVWQKDQIIRLDRQIKSREQTLNRLKESNDNLRKQVSKMRSPAAVQQRIRELNLGLAEPEPAQKWRLVEPAAEAPSDPVAPPPFSAQVARVGSTTR
jgi:cell division protein FtsB